MKNTKMKFNGTKLKELRTLAGLELEEVAKGADCDTSTVSLWENGKRRPGVKNLKRVADFFRVPVSAFFN